MPQLSSLPQTRLHTWKEPSDFCPLCGQHTSSHLCRLQFSSVLQTRVQINGARISASFSLLTPTGAGLRVTHALRRYRLFTTQHGMSRSVNVQRHFCLQGTSQVGQGPVWHFSGQVCLPQGSSLPHTSPQHGKGSAHDFQFGLTSLARCLPQGHVVVYASGGLSGTTSVTVKGQLPQSPGWQMRSQR